MGIKNEIPETTFLRFFYPLIPVPLNPDTCPYPPPLSCPLSPLQRINTIKIHTLLEKLTIPLFLIALFFILTTFLAYLTQSGEWQRVFGINLHRVLELADLREENTLATWFSSILFLFTGLAFFLLGWSSSSTFSISRLTRFIFQLTTIGAIFLSADEVGSLHETAGKSFKRFVDTFWMTAPADEKGFFWIVLFAPFLLAGLIAAGYFLYKIIVNMPINHQWQRQSAYIALIAAFICLPGVFVFELFEWHFDNLHQNIAILTCWEETFELLGMYSLFLCTTLIARRYQL